MSRVRCAVPFCKRTTSLERIQPHDEWICGEHWRGVPRHRRHQYSVARRRNARYGGPEKGWHGRIESRLWMMCKRLAIEAAAGIS